MLLFQFKVQKNNKVKLKITIFHDSAIKQVSVYYYQEYPEIDYWTNFRDKFVTAKQNPYVSSFFCVFFMFLILKRKNIFYV